MLCRELVRASVSMRPVGSREAPTVSVAKLPARAKSGWLLLSNRLHTTTTSTPGLSPSASLCKPEAGSDSVQEGGDTQLCHWLGRGRQALGVGVHLETSSWGRFVSSTPLWPTQQLHHQHSPHHKPQPWHHAAQGLVSRGLWQQAGSPSAPCGVSFPAWSAAPPGCNCAGLLSALWLRLSPAPPAALCWRPGRTCTQEHRSRRWESHRVQTARSHGQVGGARAAAGAGRGVQGRGRPPGGFFEVVPDLFELAVAHGVVLEHVQGRVLLQGRPHALDHTLLVLAPLLAGGGQRHCEPTPTPANSVAGIRGRV